jgi:3-phenylpropionate/cinnamic acid dioxygenase small subunit
MTVETTATILDPIWQEVDTFYRSEIVLLQRRDYRTWLESFSSEIQYLVPTLASTPEGRNTRDGDLGFYDEDFRMLEARVAKLENKFSWVENPPSRIRYFVQLLKVELPDDGSVVASSNELVFQHRWNLEQYFCGERTDVFVRTDKGLRLRKRVVLLDREQLGAHGLAVFF